MRGFRFWYFGEIFVLLHLAGTLHCSWWWAAFFYAVDAAEYARAKKGAKL